MQLWTTISILNFLILRSKLPKIGKTELDLLLFIHIECLEATSDYDLNVLENVIASMQVGVLSLTWKMVANVLHHDKEYAELAQWIDAGCQETTI